MAAVKRVQIALPGFGLDVDANGKFGSGTERAICFQSSSGSKAVLS
jgi:hypothetical protein